MVYVHESAPRRRIMDESEILELSTSPNHGTKEVTDREIIASFWKGDNRTLIHDHDIGNGMFCNTKNLYEQPMLMRYFLENLDIPRSQLTFAHESVMLPRNATYGFSTGVLPMPRKSTDS